MNVARWAVVALVSASVAWAQDKAPEFVTKEATGEAAMPTPAAREAACREAQQQALRNAVEQAAGVFIDASSVAIDNQLVRDQIVAGTAGYVKEFTPTEKPDPARKICAVTVKATIGMQALDRDAKAARDLVKRMGRPKVVVLIQEQSAIISADNKATAVVSTGVTEGVLTNALKKDGWYVIDSAKAMGEVNLTGIELGATQARKIGDLTTAKYILYGRVSLRNLEPGEVGYLKGADGKQTQHLFPVTAEYDLSLFETDNGVSIAKVAGSFESFKRPPGTPKLEENKSYERSAFVTIDSRKSELLDRIRAGLLEYMRNRDQNGSEYMVGVTGLPSLKSAGELKKALATLKNVTGVEQRNDFKNGKGSYLVTFRGSALELAEQIEDVTFQKRKFKAVSAQETSLELELQK